MHVRSIKCAYLPSLPLPPPLPSFVTSPLPPSLRFKQEKIFRDYRIESLANNSILFEIGLSNLIKSFTSAKTAQFVKLKLAKRGGQPCICLEARVGWSDFSLPASLPLPVPPSILCSYETR